MVFSKQMTMKWSVLDGCYSGQHGIKSHLFESASRPCVPISKNLLARIFPHLRPAGLPELNLTLLTESLYRRLCYLLVPSPRKRRLRSRSGPGSGPIFEISPRWERQQLEGNHELASQTPPLRIPTKEGRDPSSRQSISRGRRSSQSSCIRFIASEPTRELHRSGSLASVEGAAGQC